jgi:hypothetical protein
MYSFTDGCLDLTQVFFRFVEKRRENILKMRGVCQAPFGFGESVFLHSVDQRRAGEPEKGRGTGSGSPGPRAPCRSRSRPRGVLECLLHCSEGFYCNEINEGISQGVPARCRTECGRARDERFLAWGEGKRKKGLPRNGASPNQTQRKAESLRFRLLKKDPCKLYRRPSPAAHSGTKLRGVIARLLPARR